MDAAISFVFRPFFVGEGHFPLEDLVKSDVKIVLPLYKELALPIPAHGTSSLYILLSRNLSSP
jgi:hypothetical protein